MQPAMLRPGPLLAAATTVVVLTAPASPSLSAQTTRTQSPRNASYTMRARLHPVKREITGAGRVTWRNITSNPTSELQFHLYWSAWRDAKSTWLREQMLG